MKPLLVFAIGVAVGVVGYDAYLAARRAAALRELASADASSPDPELAPAPAATTPVAALEPPVAPPAFPVDRTLTNRAGVSLAARLLARDASELLLLRLTDHTTFRYPIASLCDRDQRFVRQFPESILPHVPRPTPTPHEVRSPEELTLLQRRAQLRHDIENLQLELAKQDDPNPRLPRDEIQRRLNALTNEVVTTEQQLNDLRFGSETR